MVEIKWQKAKNYSAKLKKKLVTIWLGGGLYSSNAFLVCKYY